MYWSFLSFRKRYRSYIINVAYCNGKFFEKKRFTSGNMFPVLFLRIVNNVAFIYNYYVRFYIKEVFRIYRSPHFDTLIFWIYLAKNTIFSFYYWIHISKHMIFTIRQSCMFRLQIADFNIPLFMFIQNAQRSMMYNTKIFWTVFWHRILTFC